MMGVNGANLIKKKSISTDLFMHAVRIHIYVTNKSNCIWPFLSASNVFCEYNSKQTFIMHSAITCADRKNTVLLNAIIIIKRFNCGIRNLVAKRRQYYLIIFGIIVRRNLFKDSEYCISWNYDSIT